MSNSSPFLSAAYQACLNEASTQYDLIIKRWCSGLSDILHERSMGSVAVHEKRIFQNAKDALRANQEAIVDGFALELAKAISQDTKVGTSTKDEGVPSSLSSLRFDQLELMGDDQVQESLDSSRFQQFLLLTADAELAEFSARLSTAQGSETVQADKNPLRPEVFSQALLGLLRRLPVDNGLRSCWLVHGAQLLGGELKALYVSLDSLLEYKGVVQARYGVSDAAGDQSRKFAGAHDARDPYSQADNSFPGGPGYPEGPVRASREQLLTLERLHRLMTGDDDDSFEDASYGSLPYGSAAYGAATMEHDFSHTLPAAMDALAELEQEGLVIASRKKAWTRPALPIALLREQLKGEAKTMGQALSIEVVGLMIERFTSDERLLACVRQLIAEAEPAFLHLGITDPRFFSDKKHPARQLLDAITARSLAFSSEDAPGFEQFMKDIRAVSDVLKEGYLKDAQDFVVLLADFQERQRQQASKESATQELTVQALLQVEQRILLAEKIAQEIRERPDFISGNQAIDSFLTGPWAQVMANERLLFEHGGTDSAKAVYSLTLGDLLWSLDTVQASRHRKRLIEIIPGMLNSVREGLLSIDYPLEQSKTFYDALMLSHEAAIQSMPDDSTDVPSSHDALTGR